MFSAHIAHIILQSQTAIWAVAFAAVHIIVNAKAR